MNEGVMTAGPWSELTAELDCWAEANRIASFWWRDDDAAEVVPPLERLLDLSTRYDTPLALAVIPVKTGPDLVRRLEPLQRVHVLQHGYAHINHAPAGEQASEFGTHRSLEERLTEIKLGWQHLSPFRSRAPIFVPPWNRLDPALLPPLADLGFKAVSVFGARSAPAVSAKLFEVNCHCDIINWRSTRQFSGDDKVLTILIRHLRMRRLSAAEADEPTGLLTHHLQHNEDCWRFVERLLQQLQGHQAARWIAPYEALAA